MPTLCWVCACREVREQAVAAELQQDWRNSISGELAEVMGEPLLFYGNVIVSFTAAKSGSSWETIPFTASGEPESMPPYSALNPDACKSGTRR